MLALAAVNHRVGRNVLAWPRRGAMAFSFGERRNAQAQEKHRGAIMEGGSGSDGAKKAFYVSSWHDRHLRCIRKAMKCAAS